MPPEVPIDIDDEIVDALRQSFCNGPIVLSDGKELHFLVEEEVGKFKGLTAHIYGREHPPPHVCISYQGQSTNFGIESGDRLPNNKGLERYDRNIRKWIAENRDHLIARWNATRPTDCPVGPIALKGR